MVALITNGLQRMRVLRSYSYTPRWIVFLIDVGLCFFALGFSFLFWINFDFDGIQLNLVDHNRCFTHPILLRKGVFKNGYTLYIG